MDVQTLTGDRATAAAWADGTGQLAQYAQTGTVSDVVAAFREIATCEDAVRSGALPLDELDVDEHLAALESLAGNIVRAAVGAPARSAA